MKKISDFLFNLRGVCFLIVAFQFLFIQADVFYAMIALAPLSIISVIIGSWGVFETLRRARRLTRIVALIGLIVFGTCIFVFFALTWLSPSSPTNQSPGVGAEPYLLLILVVGAFWLGSTMIGLAILLSDIFPGFMKIGGLLLIISCPVTCIVLRAGIDTYLPGVMPGFVILNMLGYAVIGIGFLSPRFKIKSAVSQADQE